MQKTVICMGSCLCVNNDDRLECIRYVTLSTSTERFSTALPLAVRHATDWDVTATCIDSELPDLLHGNHRARAARELHFVLQCREWN